MPFPKNTEINSKTNTLDNKNFINPTQFSFSRVPPNMFQEAYINPLIPNFPQFQHPYMPFNPTNTPDKK